MTTAPQLDLDQIWALLSEVPDPEIPVISITDLGIVRDVALSTDDPSRCEVTITPTYSGCPATEVIAAQIREHLNAHGIADVYLRTQLAPAWTTDWLTDNGRERVREFGIAPPQLQPQPLVQITAPAKAQLLVCPHCGSPLTELLSQFSSTPCKALYRCLACREPFDYFKPH